MNKDSSMDLIYSLIGYPSETEWIEFKVNQNNREMIGKDISALANSAAYHRKDYAYLIWGVEDGAHTLVGTNFNPWTEKAKGNQDLLIWLKQQLSANALYEFKEAFHNSQRFVVLRIDAAISQPVVFSGISYIREGSTTTKLVAGSAKEAELWRRLQSTTFELQIAEKDLSESEIVELLDVDTFFTLLNLPKPKSITEMLIPLREQKLIHKQDNGAYSVTNLGAVAIAKTLSVFTTLRKRVLRIVIFSGKGAFEVIEDREFDEGYARALEHANEFLRTIIPSQERLEGAFRRIHYDYPLKAVREILANMVFHQDLSVRTAGPLVQCFENRIEFTNPGTSLIETKRILNDPPMTRNVYLVNLMRQMDLCEENGTGWDIAVAACEEAHMLAPAIVSTASGGTKVTLFKGNAFKRMTKQERMDSVYWHACLALAQGSSINNQSVRERFGLDGKQNNLVLISRLIRDCCDAKLIRAVDDTVGPKAKRYIPFWA